MKTRNYILCVLSLVGMIGTSCSNVWDDHYGQKKSEVNNNAITIVDEPLTDYISKESSLSSMYQLFQKTGMVDEMGKKDQMFTILAVAGGIGTTRAEATKDEIYTAKTYISDASISPSNMADGQRILMWSGKYLNISKTEDANGTSIKFNNATVQKVVKLTNGYLYIVDEAVFSPRSMYEIIENLDDDYSIFREMILSHNERIFDQRNSTMIGVDNTGNTVYDSVFNIRSPYFEAVDFDIMSENLTATMLIPSNDVVNQAINEAKQSLEKWGMTREDSIIRNWVFQSAFFNKVYTKTDFDEAGENVDITSVFKKQWRTTVQEVDWNNPVSMSNGTAYYVTKMKIPTNVLIYRIKEFFRTYEYLTEEEKSTYYQTTHLVFGKIDSTNKQHNGWPAAGFPPIKYDVVCYDYKLAANEPAETTKTYSIDFVPYKYETVGGTDHKVTTYKFPAGSYKFSLGLLQEKNKKFGNISMYVYVNGVNTTGQDSSGKDIPMTTLTESTLTGTNYHLDRKGGGYPEGYDSSAASKAGVSSSGNYGLDGGTVGTLTLTGEPQPITIRFEGSGTAVTGIKLFHWCLKPTADCY